MEIDETIIYLVYNAECRNFCEDGKQSRKNTKTNLLEPFLGKIIFLIMRNLNNFVDNDINSIVSKNAL